LKVYGILTALFLVSCLAVAGEGTGNVDPGIAKKQEPQGPRDGKKFSAGIRNAIYGNRKQLLELIVDPTWRRVLCIPLPNESYDLFQQSLQDDVEKLLDLEFNGAKYGLSREEKAAVLACRESMEKYFDNFQLWKELSQSRK
jgi:hypothetical protein